MCLGYWPFPHIVQPPRSPLESALSQKAFLTDESRGTFD
jgi:hypothetical protein